MSTDNTVARYYYVCTTDYKKFIFIQDMREIKTFTYQL